MKKILALMLVMVMVLSVIACSKETPVEETKAEEPKKEEVKQEEKKAEEPKKEEVKKEEQKEEPKENKNGFKDGVVTTKEAQFKDIKVTKFEAGHFEYVDEPTIVIEFEYTNFNKEPTEAMITWIPSVEIVQETEATVEELEIAMNPIESDYDELFNNFMVKTKTDKSLKVATIYAVKYPDKPIKIIFKNGMFGESIGELIVK